METVKDLLKHFVKSKVKVEWLYGDTMHIYVRKSQRFIKDGDNSKFEECLDIANIQVLDEYQGKGIFTSFLKSIVEDYSHMNIYIESIQNPAVEHIAKKFGFVFLNCNPDDDCTNMILPKKTDQKLSTITEESYESLLQFDGDLVFCGKNEYSDNVVGSIVEDIDEEKLTRYIHSIMDDTTFQEFKDSKITYLALLQRATSIFQVESKYNGDFIMAQKVKFEDIPKEIMPLEGSYLDHDKL